MEMQVGSKTGREEVNNGKKQSCSKKLRSSWENKRRSGRHSAGINDGARGAARRRKRQDSARNAPGLAGSSPIDPEKCHPTSPQIRSQKAWGSLSSICNWLWPIRRVAPICTELGSANRSDSPRSTAQEHLPRMPSSGSFITKQSSMKCISSQRSVAIYWAWNNNGATRND